MVARDCARKPMLPGRRLGLRREDRLGCWGPLLSAQREHLHLSEVGHTDYLDPWCRYLSRGKTKDPSPP